MARFRIDPNTGRIVLDDSLLGGILGPGALYEPPGSGRQGAAQATQTAGFAAQQAARQHGAQMAQAAPDQIGKIRQAQRPTTLEVLRATGDTLMATEEVDEDTRANAGSQILQAAAAIFGAQDDPSLSPEQNKEIREQALIASGLTIMALAGRTGLDRVSFLEGIAGGAARPHSSVSEVRAHAKPSGLRAGR